jgi:hypothetical protein
MNASTADKAVAAGGASRLRSYRLVRQLHLWLGAWGAIAAVIYGFTGLVMNHRFGDAAWPQGGNEEIARDSLSVPVAARATPEALSLWLRAAHGLDSQVIRKGPPGGAGAGARAGKDAGPPPKWNFSGGSAREAWAVEFTPGGERAELKRNAHSPLSALNRLHKGVGGGWAWILLADSFALGMLLLGLSGLWMWLRGRSARDIVFSVFAFSTLLLAVVLGPALL